MPPESPARRTALPSYAHPPLVSVVLGVRTPQPVTMDMAAFAERLGPGWNLSPASVNDASHRFASVLGDRYVEAFATGLSCTWDGLSGEAYPHYEALRDSMVTAFDAWSNSLGEDDLPPESWDVTYVNRIPAGTVWQTLDDLRFCRLTAVAAPSGASMAIIDIDQKWVFRLEEADAQLRCFLKHEDRVEENQPSALWLTLQCTGRCGLDVDWLSGLDFGRRTIVSTFQLLMSVAANAFWEQRPA